MKHPKITVNIRRRYRAFLVRYHGATNYLSSRVSIIDTRRKVRVTVPYDHDFNNAIEIALAYLAKRGISVTGMSIAASDADSLLLTEDFQTPLRAEKGGAK